LEIRPISPSLARKAILAICAFLTACRSGDRISAPTNGVARDTSADVHTYSTGFSRNENPIREDGVWIGGSSGGASLREGGHFWHRGRLWGDVQTASGMAFGVDEPTRFGDPTAILTGAWGPTQTVSATVRIVRTPTGGCCHEVELRLRTSISQFRITGYEAYCSVMPHQPYCHIARWNGPAGSYWNMETQSKDTYLADGDVIKATVTGTDPAVITLYKNGVEVARAVDSGLPGGGFGAFGPWTSGSPGIGFYDDADDEWRDFGFSSFTATDVSSSAVSP